MRGHVTTVSQHNLIHRLNRALAHDGQFLKKASPTRVAKLGSYFITDIASDAVVRHNVDIEKLAREKGVLAAWEIVEKDKKLSLQ